MQIHVTETCLTVDPGAQPVAGSMGVETFTLRTDPSWEGFTKAVIFTNGTVSREVFWEGTEMPIPGECLIPGKLYISLAGTMGDLKKTTAKMQVPVTVLPCGQQVGEPPNDTPELWQQAITAFQDAQEAALSVRADADAGKFNGAPGPQGPRGEAGEQGPQGVQGAPGENGLSAFQQAVAAGYTGTEAEFSAKLAGYPTAAQVGAVAVTETVAGETEYAYPPLLPGVEYRTRERYRGQPVYIKLLELGSTPVNGAQKNVDVGAGNSIIDCRCRVASWGIPTSHFATVSISMDITFSGPTIYLWSSAADSYSAEAVVKYIRS